ncbi:MAG TPA: hypothetical protein VH914_13160 [Acidimicrobiia bacterium]|jgi:hypothetical protein|nr:hypothetical protein [Acidimicrobiia bacterium]
MRLASIAAVALISATAFADPAAQPPAQTIHTEAAAATTAGGSVFARASVSHGDQVYVFDEALEGEDAHDIRVSLTDGKTWWTATETLSVYSAGCGMGKCADMKLTKAVISEAAGVVWIRFEIESSVMHNDPDLHATDIVRHPTAIMGCSLPAAGAAPRCALANPDMFDTSTVTISGTTVTFHGDGEAQAMTFVF